MLTGTGVSAGTACARLFVVRRGPAAVVPEPAESADWALRLADGLEAARVELAAVVADANRRLGPDEAAIFEAQLMLLDDDEWQCEITRRVAAGAPAPTAVREVTDAAVEELLALDDEYLRARSADVQDVAQRLLQQLGAVDRTVLPTFADGEVVLAAGDLAPSETLGLDPAVVRAIVIEGGTRTSHAAILARQLGIPAVVGVRELLVHARPGVLCAVDGAAGTCELEPSPDVASLHRAAGAAVEVLIGPVETSDGVAVAVCANAASVGEASRAVEFGADGIGLFRTEMLLSDPWFLHDEERQAEAYSAVAAAVEGRPVVFRTFDVGGDKPVDGLSVPVEANPFLGLRGVRLCLDRPDVFEIQLRALARAAREHPNVEVMVPMISGVEELEAVHALLRGLDAGPSLRIGTMVEVPSAALMAAELAAHSAFLSVGTNDLTAYVLAADRNNPGLGELYDELHPAVLRMLAYIFEAGQASQVKVSVCGELAGDLLALPLLIGMGLRSFSVAPPLVPKIKAAVRGIDAGLAEALAKQVLRAERVSEVRGLLAAWEP
jgi:phosphoenolpyruvate-protein phosphotransferase